MNNIKLVFFGSSKFSVFCLEELKIRGLVPHLIVSIPDMPTGRGLKLTSTPVKQWAEENNLPYLTPENLKDQIFLNKLSATNSDIFLVASYGKIIPREIIETSKHGTLNIHPSLLPKYRGPSPLQEQILNNEQNIGTTIMLIDEKMDHGPIITQEKVEIPNWPVRLDDLKIILAKRSVSLFVNIINDWAEGKIRAKEQNHDEATFTKKVKKEDGLIDLEKGDPYKNFLKTQAYSTWPQAYFFVEKNGKKIRVIIKDAEYKNNQLIIKKILPEGKKEMLYTDFLRGLK